MTAPIVSASITNPGGFSDQEVIMLAPAIRREKSIKSSARQDLDQRTTRNVRAWPARAEVELQFSPEAEGLVAAAAKVNGELKQSRYPVGQIKCECQAGSLLLTGVTSQYYYVQIALQTTLAHAGDAPVKLNVVVANVA